MKPEGKGRRWLEVDEMAEMEIFQWFQYVARTRASLGSEILCSTMLKYSWRQANLRVGENGQPGASGILVSLRKRIVVVR